MRWNMAFAIKLMDQFTNLPVTGRGIWIRDSFGRPLLRKEDGWFVLMDNGEETRIVFIDVPGYEPEELCVNCKTMKKRREASLYQYLIPARGYDWPSSISFREEAGKPGTVHWVCWPETEGVFRLLKAYDPTADFCRLELKLPRGLPVRDRRILVKSGEEAEICTILDQKGPYCIMEYPLKQSYLPKEAGLSLMYRTVFDHTGLSRIPILSEKR